MFSIPEQQYSRRPGSPEDDVSSVSSARGTSHLAIPSEDCVDYSNIHLEQVVDEAFLAMDIVRSKSDSALTEANTELNLELQDIVPIEFKPSTFQDLLPGNPDSSTQQYHNPGGHLPNFQTPTRGSDHGGPKVAGARSPVCPQCNSYYRQPSFTFSYYCKRGGGLRRTTVKLSQSMNDFYDGRSHPQRQWAQRRASPVSSEEESEEGTEKTTVHLLWLSMLKMSPELKRLCICHLITWFSFTAASVFYTDFMGQAVFGGDPSAAANCTAPLNYHRGVQMGCGGLVIYAATAAVCSALLQKYLDSFDLSSRVIYMLGTLAYSVGTATMAIFPNMYVSMVMISTMGILSMSISYSSYALLGQYHDLKEYVHHSPGSSKRRFGIDCAILSCQVYLVQILVASAVGAMVDAVGSVRVIPMVASGGAFLGFLTPAFLVIYPNLEEEED
ncbi:solute carrier family 45 member 4-like [Arapaima gigas]